VGRWWNLAKAITIGCGSADAADRLDWPVELAESGLCSYMAFDSLAERTLGFAHVAKMENPGLGYNSRLSRTVDAFAPFLSRGGRIVTNHGAANPEAGASVVCDRLRAVGLRDKRIGVIHGDDCLKAVVDADLRLDDLDATVSEMGERVVGAYAYIGAVPIVECLGSGADFVIGGRLADPSCYVGPICHELGWSLDDWQRVGIATMAGHLLECGLHVTGGNFVDPATSRTFLRMDRLGFPYATVADDGSIIVSKLPGTGGGVTRDTVISQLIYEVHDPARYLTPDVIANLQNAEVTDLGGDRVRVTGITGTEWPPQLKVLVGIDWGYRVIGFMSVGGPGALGKARYCEEVLRQRFEPYVDDIYAIRFDYIGRDALFGEALTTAAPAEVQLRGAALVRSKEAADFIADELGHQVVWICHGLGGTGLVQNSRHVAATPAYLPRECFDLQTELISV
jgi:hypothetical protein